MNYELSNHAIERMAERSILKEEVHQCITQPDKSVETVVLSAIYESETIYQKQFEKDGKSYLLRVFVNSGRTPPLVKTVYKTSKLDKYQ